MNEDNESVYTIEDEDCFDKKPGSQCSELRYSNLEMAIEGVQGMYAKGNSYGSKGYYMDFYGANQSDFQEKVSHLKKNNWID